MIVEPTPKSDRTPSRRSLTANSIQLSSEQLLLASFVSRNPWVNNRIRRRAEALRLLHDRTPIPEIQARVGVSPQTARRVADRFQRGGLCLALLGPNASQELRVWLQLSPSQAPCVRFAHQPVCLPRSAEEKTPPPQSAGS